MPHNSPIPATMVTAKRTGSQEKLQRLNLSMAAVSQQSKVMQQLNPVRIYEPRLSSLIKN